uniref:Uncharacterized protein n=1 Tax=Rousettus aegyptiacus TaxID=9407 RepID=A0A7J8HSP7_ROUAE|nr:hypothetical protein HJG63_011053 [Rousettus aegyptiacus]
MEFWPNETRNRTPICQCVCITRIHMSAKYKVHTTHTPVYIYLERSTESGDPLVSWAQMLDSLGGRSTLVTEVTRETRQSEVVPLTDLRIRATRSSTQPADRRASASWSQHSSMVTQSWARPCRATGERESSPLLVSLSESNWGTANLMMSQGSGRSHRSPPRPLSAGA